MSFESMEKDNKLEALWKKFNFPTEVPMPGSEAENRLKSKASQLQKYLNRSGEAVDTAAEDRIVDELAIMVYGSPNLETDQRQALADFATEMAETPEAEMAEMA